MTKRILVNVQASRRILPDVRPIQLGDIPPGSVPWAVHALAAEEYNRHHDQSAEQLAARGGFDWCELIAALRGDYSTAGVTRARDELARIHRAWVDEAQA